MLPDAINSSSSDFLHRPHFQKVNCACRYKLGHRRQLKLHYVHSKQKKKRIQASSTTLLQSPSPSPSPPFPLPSSPFPTPITQSKTAIPAHTTPRNKKGNPGAPTLRPRLNSMASSG